MAYVERRVNERRNVDGRSLQTVRHKVRYRDSSGRQHSETVARRVDAYRRKAEFEQELSTGAWNDPRRGDVLLPEPRQARDPVADQGDPGGREAEDRRGTDEGPGHGVGEDPDQLSWMWLFALGLLGYRSGMFPRPLALLLMLCTVCYMGDAPIQFLAPAAAHASASVFVIPEIVGEVALLLYLLIKGVRTPTGQG